MSQAYAASSNLTLLVHPDPVRLAREVASRLEDGEAVALSVNRDIIGRIQTRHRLGAEIADLARRLLDERPPGAVILTDISLLFDPETDVDPLALLCQLSQSRELVVAWPGSHLRGTLSYGVPEHAHYRTWSAPQARIITLR